MKIYLVGGAVRDKLLGLPVHERDWVVVGARPEDMLKLGYKQVGKEFPVFLHPKTNEEYALARMERKVKPGYTGFVFDSTPTVTLEEDLLRRDLTINAMAESESGELIDPYHGKQDLDARLLRHVSPAFAEDPVRILRIGRFLARFSYLGFSIAPETLTLMQQMTKAGEVNALVAERVWKELERALAEPHPEQFFAALAACDALPILFPALDLDALTVAAQQHATTLVRFSVLFYALPDAKKAISAFSQRYRIPNHYQALATLTALHVETALAAPTLTADALLQLFSALDIFRREERFHDFLKACDIIASSQKRSFNPARLAECAKAAKSYDVQELLREGLEGNELAIKLKERRREQIAEWQRGLL